MKCNHNQARWHLQTDEAPLKPDYQNPLADSTWEWQTCPNMVSSATTAATSTQSHRDFVVPTQLPSAQFLNKDLTLKNKWSHHAQRVVNWRYHWQYTSPGNGFVRDTHMTTKWIRLNCPQDSKGFLRREFFIVQIDFFEVLISLRLRNVIEYFPTVAHPLGQSEASSLS